MKGTTLSVHSGGYLLGSDKIPEEEILEHCGLAIHRSVHKKVTPGQKKEGSGDAFKSLLEAIRKFWLLEFHQRDHNGD
ncbi:hypothetical protein KIN20_019273 [Parelaphostrongylus tenuis]|uniref:Uncharacterized protein n=1 Tax=Parelaphostrongylus tenuis TaxID=148309 RepID=A0AAD5MKU6_PARTN|nr:hypothetical protein KIN20_019273 [Parelaphostrongylus tenuis]